MTKTMKIALFAMLSATLGLGLTACGDDEGDDTTTDTGVTEDVTPDGDDTPACDDGVMNGDEEGVDCGGSCATACEVEATCDDGEMNGDEEGVDCGGSCPDACETVDPTCDDGEMNGDEEGVDCGGSCPDACSTGDGCTGAASDGSDLDFLGECSGTVARWCQDGEVGEYDCADEGATCEYIDEEIGYWCVAAPVEVGGECWGDSGPAECLGTEGGCVITEYSSTAFSSECMENLGTCDETAEEYTNACDGDVLLFGCAGGQNAGLDCAGLGGSCATDVCALPEGLECDGELVVCAEGLTCEGLTDETLGTCTGTAVEPTCDDGVQNGDEEGVDCGGATCDACVTENTAPVIDTFSVTGDTDPVVGGASVAIVCHASDADGDTVTIEWTAVDADSADAGSFSGLTGLPEGTNDGAWISPMVTGTYTLTCTVTDGNGGEASESYDVDVQAAM